MKRKTTRPENIITKRKSTIKSIFLASLFFLTACVTNSHWSLQSINTDEIAYHSNKLSYKQNERLERIDLEFLSLPESLNLYLVIHSTPITDPLLTITTPDDIIQTSLAIREGGQRLYLPSSAQDTIVDALLQGKVVTLTLPGYCTTIYPDNFPKLYKRLYQPSPTSLLLQKIRENTHYF